MNNSFDTSFIPQQPLLRVEGSLRRRESVSFALVLALVIFFLSLGLSGGVYFYKTIVDKRVLVLEKQLESKEASLKIDDIERYKAIDARLDIAKKLLLGHTAFSSILDLLEKITARDVGWTALSYGIDDKDGSIVLSLSGQTSSYDAVYNQAQSWRGIPMLLKKVDVDMPVIRPENGIVTFGAKLVIAQDYVKYARLITGMDAAQKQEGAKVATSTGIIPATP